MKTEFQPVKYLSGFGNHVATEAVPGALPPDQNSPQKPPLGLYAEQFSGSSFTAPRALNKKNWFYRIRPSVLHPPFEPYSGASKWNQSYLSALPEPNQMRWDPLPEPTSKVDFVDSMTTFVGTGDVAAQFGCAVHVYCMNASMVDRYFFNSDAEMLIVLQHGSLEIRTECGILNAEPSEIVVIPRGMRFQIHILDTFARGYVCENFGQVFRLPELGPIGANGLAAPRDFLSPVAWYEEREAGDYELITKYLGRFFKTHTEYSPLDVVAWHGNNVPYKYDLRKFNTMGTVSFDHPDPSIFTVLTSSSSETGTANCDFVIFPPRWMVATHTFRPPYYHRNIMSEFMGLIHGVYDAKEEGFTPGGASLHNCMSAHGPDAATFERATNKELKPEYLDQTLAFMFETRYPFSVSEYARVQHRQFGYYQCWQDLKSHFKKP